MTVDFVSKEECTGCQACQNVCPVGAITFEQNEEGFYIPVIIKSACINCGKCYKMCPTNTNHQKKIQAYTFLEKPYTRADVAKVISNFEKECFWWCFCGYC